MAQAADARRPLAALSPKHALTLDQGDVDFLSAVVQSEDGLGRPTEAFRAAAGALAYSKKLTPLQRAAVYRELVRSHPELQKDGAETNILRPLAGAASDLDALRMLVRMEVEDGSLWLALRDADYYAASPELTGAQRAAASYVVARARVLVGDEPGAERSFKRVLELKPGDSEASYGLAVLLRARPEEALPFADQAARSAGTVARRAAAERLAGEIRLDLGDAAGARASLSRALRLAGDDLDVLGDMVRLERDRPQEASAYARRAAAAAERTPLWSRPAAYRFSARMWLELNNYSEAAAGFRRAIRINPDDLDALEALVRIKRERPEKSTASREGDEDGAPRTEERERTEEELAGALRSDPDDLEALRGLIELRRAQKRRAEAVSLAERFIDAIAESPDWRQPDAYRVSARTWMELGDAPRARVSVAHAQELDPRALEPFLELNDATWPVNAYSAIGTARAALKDLAGAEKSLKQALALNPGAIEVLSTLAQVEADGGRPAEALANVELALEAAKKAPSRRLELERRKAGIQLELGDLIGAERTLKQALELAPGSVETLWALVRLEAGRGRPAEALSYSERELAASGKASPLQLASVYVEKAQLQIALKDEPSAERSLRRALDLDPGAPGALKLLAEVELKLKDYVGAEKNLKQALALDPGDIEALSALVQAEDGLGRPAEALAAAALALEASQKEPPLRRADLNMRKAQLQFKLKDEAGADASLRQALELAPGHREALLALIQLERRRGRPSEALAYAGKLVGVSQKGTPSERAAAYRESARLKFELSDEAGAREDCARAFESMPGDVEVLSMLVEAGSSSPRETLALVEKHRPAGAELQAPWLALRGLTRARLKDAAGARDDFAAAVAADAKGICFGELFQARRDLLDPAFFDRCLERFPGSAALYSDRGVARCGLGRTDGAASDFRKAIELSPEFLEARLNLASVLASQNRRAEALVETDKAVAAAKDPGSPVYARLLELQASLREPTAKIK